MKFSQRPYKKRGKSRKMRRYRRKKTLVNRALQPIPQRYICKLKYAENLFLGNGATPQSVYSFNLNNLYDPNRTGTGHQPYGYDQLEKLFTGYRVFGASYNVSVTTNTGEAIRTYFLGVIPLNSNGSDCPNTISAIAECPRARYVKQLVSAPLKTIRGHISLPSLMGVSKATYRADNNYSSAVVGGPTLPATLNIMVSPLDESTIPDAGAIQCMVEITYHVEFIGPVLQPQSS